MIFEACYVIGTGQFAFKCAEYLQNMGKIDGVYEYGNYRQSKLEMLCKAKYMLFSRLHDRNACDNLMREIESSGRRTLIVSASNTYIFPKFMTKSKNVEIINYHPALLSRHLGRNAEAWSIYEQDPAAGVTWHKVTEHIDKGEILAEGMLELNGSETAVKLMLKQYNMGYELFKGFIKDFMAGREVQTKEIVSYGKMHYSFEIPNNGILDVSWSSKQISAFLRCMDYGQLETFGKPVICENHEKYFWDSYRIVYDGKTEYDLSKDKVIEKEDIFFILHNYRRFVQEGN